MMLIDREFAGNGGSTWKPAVDKINKERHAGQSVREAGSLRDRYGNILNPKKHVARVNTFKYIVTNHLEHKEAVEKALGITEAAITAGAGALILTNTQLQNNMEGNPDADAMLVSFVAGQVCAYSGLDSNTIANDFKEYLLSNGGNVGMGAEALGVVKRLAAILIAGPDNEVDVVDDEAV